MAKSKTLLQFFCILLIGFSFFILLNDVWFTNKNKHILTYYSKRKHHRGAGLETEDIFSEIHTKLKTKSPITQSNPEHRPLLPPDGIANVVHRVKGGKHKLKPTVASLSRNSSREPGLSLSYPNEENSHTVLVNGSSANFFHASHWDRLVNNVNCRALILGDKDEQDKTADILEKETRITKQANYYIDVSKNCENFRHSSGYITLPVNSMEENFPLAFSLLMYKDIEQAERLLRAIYRPQNVYCIHIDIKSDPEIRNGMKAIAQCFDNVYILPDSSDVQWGTFTVLEPELGCMKLLWTKKKWKYFINLTGQEFPLKTNLELIRILQAFNGANNLEGTRKRANTDRWESVGPAPHDIKPTKGSVHIVVSRGYVDYLLHRPVAQDFLTWVKGTYTPDETFFATLNHNPHLGVPGSYLGEPETSLTHYPFLTRYKVWQSGIFNLGCNGKYVRSICIFGIEDLPRLTSVPHLFVNKFHWDYQHYARDCLEEWHFNKTRDELIHPSSLDLKFYEELSFVKLATRHGNSTVT